MSGYALAKADTFVPGRCAVQIRPCLVERRVPAGDVPPMACRLHMWRWKSQTFRALTTSAIPGIRTRYEVFTFCNHSTTQTIFTGCGVCAR